MGLAGNPLPPALRLLSSGNGGGGGRCSRCFPSCLVPVVVELSCVQATMNIAIHFHATDYGGPAAGGLLLVGGVGGAVFHAVG